MLWPLAASLAEIALRLGLSQKRADPFISLVLRLICRLIASALVPNCYRLPVFKVTMARGNCAGSIALAIAIAAAIICAALCAHREFQNYCQTFSVCIIA